MFRVTRCYSVLALTLAVSGCFRTSSSEPASVNDAPRSSKGANASGADAASPGDGVPTSVMGGAASEPQPPRDAAPPDGAATAEPPRGPSELVFTKTAGAVTSLYAMSTADFSVRKLDPPPATRPLAGQPVAYSPDGRKLVIAEQHFDETRIFIAYRCREAACAGAPQPYREVLRTRSGPLSKPAFAPDSSGMVLPVQEGSFYISLEEDGPGRPLHLADERRANVQFVAGSRAVLGEGAADVKPGIELIDLASRETGTLRRGMLRGSDGTVLTELRSVSPDRQHWLAAPGLHAFSVKDVLEGNYVGRALSPDATWAHAGDQWICGHHP